MLCSATGMMLMASANDLITCSCRSRSSRSRCTCSPRSTGAALDVAGSRPQVLPARLVLVGGVPLRHRARLRRDGHDEPHRHRRLPRDARRCSHDGVLLLGHRVPARRSRLQGRGRAVPHVDARRVPGRADAGDRVHGRARRRPPRSRRCCGCFVGAFELYRVDWRPAIWGLAVLSLLVGSIAALVQTDVKRMLAYSSISARGLRADRRAGRDREGNERRAVLRARVRVDGDRRVRGRRRSSPARATTSTRSPTYRGLAVAPAGARRVAHAVPARAGRRAADRRVRREALGVQRGASTRASTRSR